jgi:hypothetical protein
LQAIEWMKLREGANDDGRNEFALVDYQNLKVSLPIEGILRVAGWDHSTSDLELWTPLFGLPIHCPERVNGQFIAPNSVCYYSEDTISALLSENRLQSFWFACFFPFVLITLLSGGTDTPKPYNSSPPLDQKNAGEGSLPTRWVLIIFFPWKSLLISSLLRTREDNYDDCIDCQ